MAPRFLFVPWHFHPPFKTQTGAWLLQLQARGIHLIPAERFREVRGIFCWQPTSSWQASWAFWVTHHLAFWQEDREKLLLNDKKKKKYHDTAASTSNTQIPASPRFPCHSKPPDAFWLFAPSRFRVFTPVLEGWWLCLPPSCAFFCPYPDTWRPACQSALCPGTQHTWWPSCWAPRWSDGGCCGAFAPSGAGCTLQGTKLISRVTTKSIKRWHWQR